MSLGGSVCVRNCVDLDYNWVESVMSLLPICDEVVICDCDSDDKTKELAKDWATQEPKIKVVDYLWTDPKGDTEWYVNWLNHARAQLATEWSIYLDADELLHEDSQREVLDAARDKKVLICNRHNFWKDAQHLIPDGVCCSREVIRVGPTSMFLPSDYPDPRCQEAMDQAVPSDVHLMHYGFLRERKAFFRKARTVQKIWADSFDPRLEAAEKAEGNWMDHSGVVEWQGKLEKFKGTHPEIIKPWLRQRGYEI